jgi:SAM-dependent methyltransferase
MRLTAPLIFDRRTYAMHRARAARQGSTSFLGADVGENLAERLSAVRRRFRCALDLGSRPAIFRFLEPRAERWIRTSLTAEEIASSVHAVIADEEGLPFAEESFDLIVSVLSLHAVNDLPGALVQIRRALAPDGLFLAALFGGTTLSELRRAFTSGESDILGGTSPRVAPFADVRDLGSLLQRAGFALPVADIERTTIRYSEFATLVADLRALGESCALMDRSRLLLRRDVLAASLNHYAAHDADADEKWRATFDVVYLTGWAPHESQPKPLKPGRAQTRLADALGTTERPAGDVSPKPR